jgi:hypothetical protein
MASHMNVLRDGTSVGIEIAKEESMRRDECTLPRRRHHSGGGCRGEASDALPDVDVT